MSATGYWEWYRSDACAYIVEGGLVGNVTHIRHAPGHLWVREGWYAWARPLCLLPVADSTEGMMLVELCWRPRPTGDSA